MPHNQHHWCIRIVTDDTSRFPSLLRTDVTYRIPSLIRTDDTYWFPSPLRPDDTYWFPSPLRTDDFYRFPSLLRTDDTYRFSFFLSIEVHPDSHDDVHSVFFQSMYIPILSTKFFPSFSDKVYTAFFGQASLDFSSLPFFESVVKLSIKTLWSRQISHTIKYSIEPTGSHTKYRPRLVTPRTSFFIPLTGYIPYQYTLMCPH
jgi:hypothetical protein